MTYTAAPRMSPRMAAIMQSGSSRDRNKGSALMGVLLIIILVGFSLAEAGNSWSNIRQREREQELLKVGDKIREAIGNYYHQSPGMVKQFPPTLEALLKDDRFPTPQRYLRQLYIDPTTGRPGWGILEAPSGGIMGVYSLSLGKPFKTKEFPERYQSFENRKYYMEWIFAYLPETDDDLNENLQ
jgi:type II secretory pathway pseudopilin PulG